MTGLDLSPHGEAGRPHDVGAATIVRPRCGMEAAGHRFGHQRVVGGVVLDGVDAVPEAVVAVQLGLVLVGQLAPADHLRIAGPPAPGRQLGEPPVAAEPANPLHQGDVSGRHVMAGQRCGLVDDLVGSHPVSMTPRR